MIELIPVPAGCTRIWEVWANHDTLEGRGPVVLLGRFLDAAVAQEFARNKGSMGASDGEVRQAIVFNSIEAFNTHTLDEVRRRAWNKLSREERFALGLEA